MLLERYETQADLDAEAEIADAVVAHLGLHRHRKLDERYYVADRALIDVLGKVEAFAECKDRNWTYGAGDGLIVSLFKVMRCRQLAQVSTCPAYIAPRFRGGEICIANFFDHEPGVVMWGRSDRPNDANAIEPCVRFDWDTLRRIK